MSSEVFKWAHSEIILIFKIHRWKDNMVKKIYICVCMTPVQGDSSCYMSYKLYAITAFTLLVSGFHYCDVTSGRGEGENENTRPHSYSLDCEIQKHT